MPAPASAVALLPDSPAFLAAGSPLGLADPTNPKDVKDVKPITYVRGGRYGAINQPNVSAKSVERFLKDQDPKNPGRCYTKAGLTPRRVIESSDSDRNPKPGWLVWGECCDGWRHFDCLGLIDFAFAQVRAKEDKELRAVWQWASPKNTVKASPITSIDAVLGGDLVSNQGTAIRFITLA